MKKLSVILALLMVLGLGVSVLAADIKVGGRVEYGVEKAESDEDPVWYTNPKLRLIFSNDNFEIRLVGLDVIDTATFVQGETDSERFYPPTDVGYRFDIHTDEHGHHFLAGDAWLKDCDEYYYDFLTGHGPDSFTTTTKYSVLVERAFLKLPVEGFGTFTAGRSRFSTSDNGGLDRLYDGLGWSGTFDNLTAMAMYAVGSKFNSPDQKSAFGGRLAYAADLGGGTKLTLGATGHSVEDADDASYAVDARVDLGEAFDVYAEVGRSIGPDGVYDEDEDDIQLVCGEYRVGGFEFDGSYNFAAEEAEVSVEKTLNNVLVHVGYVMPEDDDNKLVAYGQYNF